PQTMVELGTGAGVSGLALMRGAPEGAVLTTLDPDAEAQRAAREVFGAEGYPSSTTRLIAGRGRTVLPKLSAAAYDLVFIDADPLLLEYHVTEAARLLRSGGMLVIHDALDQDRVPKPAIREASTVMLRDVGNELRDNTERWRTSTLVPIDTGLLLAIKIYRLNAVMSCGYHAGQRSLEFLCFFIIKFNDTPASAVGRNSHHYLALFTNYFHWAITGTGLHSSHYCSFLCASSPRRERFA